MSASDRRLIRQLLSRGVSLRRTFSSSSGSEYFGAAKVSDLDAHVPVEQNAFDQPLTRSETRPIELTSRASNHGE